MQGPCLQPGTGGSVEATQGSSYAEFAITAVECTNATYYYEAAGYSDPWPVVRYRIRLKRASSYYVPGYVALPVEARSPGHSPGHSPGLVGWALGCGAALTLRAEASLALSLSAETFTLIWQGLLGADQAAQHCCGSGRGSREHCTSVCDIGCHIH